MRILVPTEQFPSRVQPWLLNTVEQAVLRGAEVWLTSALPPGSAYPRKVDRMGLLERTLTLELGSPRAAAVGALRLLGTGSGSRRARRGLPAALAAARRNGSGLRGVANALIQAPAFGLPPLDLVHSHALPQAFDCVAVSRSHRAPQIHTYHGMHLAGVEGLAEEKRRTLFRHVALCLVNTDFARREVESIGCPGEKIRILPQGVVLEEFPFRPTEPAPERPLRLLTVARLDVDKGHRFAIEAVRLLAARGFAVEYRIVGGGPLLEELESRVRELEVGGHVHFVGRVDDAALRREYAAADVFVLPSVRAGRDHHEETQGVVVQEAQASGTIVVATRTGGIPECVDDGVSAFLVEERRPDQIADAVAHVAGHPGRWAEWQRRGRAWVEARFDMARIGDRLWTLYQEVAAAAGPREGQYRGGDSNP